MESGAAPAHRGRVSWPGLLLAVSLFTFCSPPTTARPTIVPAHAAEGKDALLLVDNLPEDPRSCAWHKGEDVNKDPLIARYVIDTQKITLGPAHSGQETIYPNGSLLFRNVTLNDTGYYSLLVITNEFESEVGTGQLRVYPELPKPSITSNSLNPEEHKDPVVLTCEPHTQDTTYLWMINSQSLPGSPRLELSKDNRTLTLLRLTRKDTGPYECETRNPVSAGRSDPLTLNVLYGPDAPIIFPSDSHYRAGANLSLSCHTASNPPAQYSWLINGRPQQPTRELFIPRVTANDRGSYACLAHNSVTGLNRTTVRTITVSDEKSYTGSSPVGTIAGIVTGVLFVVVLGTFLGWFLYLRRRRRASDTRGLRQQLPAASTPGPLPSGHFTSPSPPHGPRTAGPIYEDLLRPSADIYCRINPSTNGAS